MAVQCSPNTCITIFNVFNFQCTFTAPNLCLLIDSKALVPSHIQSRSPLSVYLTAVGGNWSTRRKHALRRCQVPTSSAHDRHWELSVLLKDTKWQPVDSNPWPTDLWASALPTELPLFPTSNIFLKQHILGFMTQVWPLGGCGGREGKLTSCLDSLYT